MGKKNFILYIMMVGLLLSGCSKNSDSEKLSYGCNCKYQVGEDGWIYHFYIEYKKAENGNRGNIYCYDFDGANVKYKEIKNNGVQVIENGKVAYIAPGIVPLLSLGEDTRDDVKKIDGFFSDKKFTGVIKESELESLKLKTIDKSMVVNLFNQVIRMEPCKESGKYWDYYEQYTKKEETKDGGYSWQVNYISCYGYLKFINIELIYSDGTYLSDKVINKTADEEAVKLYNKITEIEDKIVKIQNYSQDEYKDLKIDDADFSRLCAMLNDFENNTYQSKGKK